MWFDILLLVICSDETIIVDAAANQVVVIYLHDTPGAQG